MSRTDELETRIASLGSAVVAFSGGVDSSLVAALAARALGPRALAVTAVSPALATGELDGARGVAEAVGIAHEVISTDELAREGYVRNDRDRCYHCKTELYEQLWGLARARGYAAVLSGANADDTGDWRPGLRAAAEHGVVHPLLEAGVGKEEVRALAAELGVPSAWKPASPCLASRLPVRHRGRPGRAARRSTAPSWRSRRSATRSSACATTARSAGWRSPPTTFRAHSRGAPSWRTPSARPATREVEIDEEPFRSGSLNRFTTRLPVLG